VDTANEDTALQPRFRLTVRSSGSIVAVDWDPRFKCLGPLYVLLEARARARVAIADLTVIRDDEGQAIEAIVDFRCGGSPTHRAALRAWAASVGYRRLWLDDEVVELEPSPGGAVETRCGACGTRLADGEPAFWTFVRRFGAFPTSCVLCGGDLRQWTPVRQRGDTGQRTAKDALSRPSAVRAT
jgi:hypothetical protein